MGSLKQIMEWIIEKAETKFWLRISREEVQWMGR
jgi:hypothetical protein